MNTNIYLDSYRSAKRDLRRSIRKITISHMVAQNIRDILPDWIIIKPYPNIPQILTLVPTVDVDAERFDKFVAKFSKKLRRKPKVNIGETFSASWYVFLDLYNPDGVGITLEFSTSNAEKCDISYTDVVIQKPVLTGYCKALAEKYA